MTDTLTAAWNAAAFLRVIFETATGPSWCDTLGGRPAPVSGAEAEHTVPSHYGGLASSLQGRMVHAF